MELVLVMDIERARRQSLSAKLEAYLKDHQGEWIPIRDLALIGGIGGWRTRLSELTRRQIEPMRIEHNGLNGSRSCHRYVPCVLPLTIEALERTISI